MTATNRVKANRYNHLIALFVCLGSYSYGFNSGIIGGVIGQPSWYSYFDMDPTGSYATSIIETSIGIYYAGGFFGCLTVNWLTNKLGRRAGIQIITAFTIVAAVIQTASVHIAMFIVGRLLGGAAAGMINATVPIYISEIAPAAQRGRLVGFHGALTIVAYVSITHSRLVSHADSRSREWSGGQVWESTSRPTRRYSGACCWLFRLSPL
jgi:MFS family permease